MLVTLDADDIEKLPAGIIRQLGNDFLHVIFTGNIIVNHQRGLRIGLAGPRKGGARRKDEPQRAQRPQRKMLMQFSVNSVTSVVSLLAEASELEALLFHAIAAIIGPRNGP